jgi:KipI family sensor histidine kinase inhibitor
MRTLPYGDRAVLVEVDGPPISLRDALTAADVVGIDELVPAARTLLVRYDPQRVDRAQVVAAVEAAASGAARATTRVGSLVTLAVHYDGADLAEVAQLAGCSVDEVVHRHSGAEYTVAFCGFAPGFAYLTGLDPSLRQPRLATPRARVPAGAVGIAGEYTAAYPRASPGGWRLIGRTDAELWSLGRAEPALLRAGARVRVEPR